MSFYSKIVLMVVVLLFANCSSSNIRVEKNGYYSHNFYTKTLKVESVKTKEDLNTQLQYVQKEYAKKMGDYRTKMHLTFKRMDKYANDTSLPPEVQKHFAYRYLSLSVVSYQKPAMNLKIIKMINMIFFANQSDNLWKSGDPKTIKTIKTLATFELAKRYYALKDMAKAKEYLLTSIENFETLKMNERLIQASIILIEIEKHQNNYKQVEHLVTKALKINQSTLKFESVSYLYELKANQLIRENNYKKAQSVTQKAIDSIQELPRREQYRLIPHYVNLARIHNHYNQLNKARHLYQQSIESFNNNHLFPSFMDKVEDLDVKGKLKSKLKEEIGNTDKNVAQYKNSKDFVVDGNVMCQKYMMAIESGYLDRQESIRYLNLASKECSSSDLDKVNLYSALSYGEAQNYNKSLSYLNKVQNKTPRYYIQLAQINMHKRDFTQAIQNLTKAKEEYENNQAKDLNLLIVYRDLIESHKRIKDYKNAFRYAQKSLAFLKRLDKSSIQEPKLWFKNNFIKHSMDNLLQSSATLALDTDATHFIFNQWINYKRTLSSYEIDMQTIYKHYSGEMGFDIKEYNYLQAQLGKLHKSKNLNHEEIRKVKLRLQKFERVIFQQITNSKTIDYRDIQKALKSKELYIDFAKVNNQYICFTLDKQGRISMTKINAKGLDSFMREVLNRMNNIAKGYIFPDEGGIKGYLSSLHKTIFANIQIPKGIDTLIISPDGLLNLLPFEALYRNGRYLIEDYKISYIPSAKEFVNLSSRGQGSSNSVDIFALPNYNSTTTSSTRKLSTRALKLGKFNALPFTKKEAKSIQRLLGSKFSVNLFMGKDANEKNLLAINSPKILHIATHGFYQANSSVANPMLKSGIVLSGANRAIAKGDNFGIINALDLSRLNLRNTKLVTLSACESGVGNIEEAEGVGSISKAFIKAGSSYVVMSLWSVSDNITAEFMKSFYGGVARGDEYASYLRETKLKMIQNSQTAHPYFWAGFVGSGR